MILFVVVGCALVFAQTSEPTPAPPPLSTDGTPICVRTGNCCGTSVVACAADETCLSLSSSCVKLTPQPTPAPSPHPVPPPDGAPLCFRNGNCCGSIVCAVDERCLNSSCVKLPPPPVDGVPICVRAGNCCGNSQTACAADETCQTGLTLSSSCVKMTLQPESMQVDDGTPACVRRGDCCGTSFVACAADETCLNSACVRGSGGASVALTSVIVACGAALQSL
jgi:hypothetical protein